jgi:hypothetical protein
MSDIEDTQDSNPVEEATGPMCRHLRSKGMYVYTDGVDMGFDHDYDNTIFWCLKTMKSFGPDDEMVERESCCRPGRACYQAH